MAESLVFKVKRSQPELVAPAKATPRELKLLSDIDDQDGLRVLVPKLHFYKYEPSMKGMDQAKVIKEAVAQTLVFYYPFAGRLRELAGAGRKLAVDCTGEGVLFVEADADVRLADFGDSLQPPFPCLEELLFDVPGSGGVLNCPLLFIQVTRLKCGGFILALHLNHTMADATGLAQFMTAMGEMARGVTAPSVPPVWRREILNARNPPRVTYAHCEYDQVEDNKGTMIPLDDMAYRSFFFGPSEISAIRRLIPGASSSTKFELVTACLWRCRTRALQADPEEEVRFMCTVNARSKFNPPLPSGYYGNGFASPVAATTAGKLCANHLGYALELVKKAKAKVTEEYMRSLADLMAIKGRPHFTAVRSFAVSDLTHLGFEKVDVGWGRPVYGGIAVGAIPGVGSFYIPFKNKAGEKGILVPICLPASAMERLVKELDTILLKQNPPNKTSITSAL